MKVKEEKGKFWLKTQQSENKDHGICYHHSWEIDGEAVETVTDFISLGPRITTGDDCSHEINRSLFLGRNIMTKLDSVLRSRDITLPMKVHLVKAIGFSSGYVWV